MGSFFIIKSDFFKNEKKIEDEKKNWTKLRASILKIDAKCELWRQWARSHRPSNTWQSDRVTDLGWIERQTTAKQKGFQDADAIHKQSALPGKSKPKKVLNVGKIMNTQKMAAAFQWNGTECGVCSPLTSL